MDKIYFAVVLSLFYIVQTVEFPTVTTYAEATTSGVGCNTATLRVCEKEFIKFMNVSSSQPMPVDHAGLYNFTCGSGAEGYIDCLKNKVKPFCSFSESDEFVRNYISFLLPTIERMRKLCRIMSEADYVGIGQCITDMVELEPYIDCVYGIGRTTDRCSMTQLSTDCAYTYMDLRCPEYTIFFKEYAKVANVTNCTITIGNDEPKTCDKNMYKACSTVNQSSNTSTTEAIQYACSEDGIASATCARKVKTICIHSNQSVGLDILDVLPSADKTRKMCADKEGMKKYSECYSKFGSTNKFQNCTSQTDQDVKFCSLLKQTYKCIEIGIQDHCSSSLDFYKKYMPYELEAGHPCASITSAASVKIPSMAYLVIYILFFIIYK